MPKVRPLLCTGMFRLRGSLHCDSCQDASGCARADHIRRVASARLNINSHAIRWFTCIVVQDTADYNTLQSQRLIRFISATQQLD